MTDPITLGILGTLAATEGIKFLFAQATELIKAFKERKQRQAGSAQPEEALKVPITGGEKVLDATPTNDVADASVVEREEGRMLVLRGRLETYASELSPVPQQDDQLAADLQELRGLLEAAYGQRLTFLNEHRDKTGTRVSVSQVIEELAGRAVGARNVREGDVKVDQDVKKVAPGGELLGVDTVDS